MTFLSFIYIYLFGGVSFLPLLILGFIYLHPKDPKYENNDDINEDTSSGLSAGEIEEDALSGLLAHKTGWLTVTQEYIESPDDISSQTQSINEGSAYSTLYKLVQKNNSEQIDPVEQIHQPNTNDKVKSTNSNLKKHRYYAILRHGNLFLYKNQNLKDVKHVIVVSNQFVTLWPRDIPDGQLFTKRTAICLIKKDWSRTRRLLENFDNEKLTVNDIVNSDNKLTPPKGSFFIYCDTNIEKEDWYFTLIKGSKSENDFSPYSSSLFAKTLHFETREMMDLIQTLYSSEGQLQTKWFNGILGRLFLSLKRTEVLRNFLETRITKKLNKIKTPGFLDKFKLGNLDPGDSIPFFTFPNLKEINPNGTLIVSSYIHYHGNLSCNVSTKVNLNFGTRFKQSQVDVVLKVTIQKIEGPVIFKIKPPPSDRIWYAFEIEPVMNLKIEPIISSRPVTYNIINSTIEKRFKEAIKESLVVPNFDDIVFYNTEGDLYRGGIWDQQTEENTDNESPSSGKESSSKEEIPSLTPEKTFDIETKLINSASTVPSLKISATLNDLSQKIKKSKSTHTVGVTGSNHLSDGSVVEPKQPGALNKNLNKTLKKLGDWYNSKDEKEPRDKEKVEMYSSRRRPRVSSMERATEPNFSPVDMFAKTSPTLHRRSDSRFSVQSEMSQQTDTSQPSTSNLSSPTRLVNHESRSQEEVYDDDRSASSFGPALVVDPNFSVSNTSPYLLESSSGYSVTNDSKADMSYLPLLIPEDKEIDNEIDNEINELIHLDEQDPDGTQMPIEVQVTRKSSSNLHRKSPPPL